MKYFSHKDIPQEFRRAILDSSGQNRIHKVSIEECNELIEDFLEFQQINIEMRRYEIYFQKTDGAPEEVFKCDGYKEAAIMMDRLTDYGENLLVVACMVQNGRPVRGFKDGKFIEDTNSIYSGMGASIGETPIYMTNQVSF